MTFADNLFVINYINPLAADVSWTPAMSDRLHQFRRRLDIASQWALPILVISLSIEIGALGMMIYGLRECVRWSFQ